MAAPVLSPAESASIARAAARASECRLFGRGVCRVPGSPGPVWAVCSTTRASRVHLVWVAGGRLLCSCEARRLGRAFTCLHSQFVRSLLLAGGRAACSACGASVAAGLLVGGRCPACLAGGPAPVPPSPSGGGVAPAVCPSCGLPADPAELAELGECLTCLSAAARALGAEAPLCQVVGCGAPAVGEVAAGQFCATHLPPVPPVPSPPPPPAPAPRAARAAGAKAKAKAKAEQAAQPCANPHHAYHLRPDEQADKRGLCERCAASHAPEIAERITADRARKDEQTRAERIERKRAEHAACAIVEREQARQRRYREEGRGDDWRRSDEARALDERARQERNRAREEAPIDRGNAPFSLFK